MAGKVQVAFGRLFLLAILSVIGQSLLADTTTPQVQIEVKFVELNRNTARDLGVDIYLPTTAEGNVKVGGPLNAEQTQNLLNNVDAQKNLKTNSAGVALVPNGEKGAIDISSMVGASGGGVALTIVPTVNADRTRIGLRLVPEVQNVGQPASDVSISAGQTLIVGGSGIKTPAPNPDLIILIVPQIIDVLSHTSGKGPERIRVETIGTGETIGHVADLKIQNLTDEPLDIFIPPIVLESKSGQDQDYVCPEGKNATIVSRQAETIPLNGVCINRDKPPVTKGTVGALVVNTVDPKVAQHSDCHIPAKAATDLLRICGSIYAAVDQLQKNGALKDFPYKDKQEQENILVQWDTWANPRICEIAKTQPATKDDLRKVAYKQIEEKGPPSSATKKKIDNGIDTIFEKIELTSAKAKDIEGPGDDAAAGTSPPPINISDNTPAPVVASTPQTQEKKKSAFPTPRPPDEPPKTEEKGPKKWPKPIQDWLDKKRAAYQARIWSDAAKAEYSASREWFFEQNKHWSELKRQRDEAEELARRAGGKEKEDFKKVEKELQKLEGELEKDYLKTPEGQKEFEHLNDAEKAAAKASATEKEAGKNIEQTIKDDVLKEEALHPPLTPPPTPPPKLPPMPPPKPPR